jgi:hypothetical protein
MQHLQKALEQMNLKPTEILSDITGLTGRAILRAILRGTRAPEKLAKYRDKACKARCPSGPPRGCRLLDQPRGLPDGGTFFRGDHTTAHQGRIHRTNTRIRC